MRWYRHSQLNEDKNAQDAINLFSDVDVCTWAATLKVLARNDLREAIMATPAIIDAKLYIRTARQLFAFGD